jgi:TonB family protein
VDDGREGSTEEVGPSIAGSLKDMERALDLKGTAGLPSGTGRQMGPLFFDPQGADFTLWINHFKNEVYRNWLIPQSVVLGGGGEVRLQFSVSRDGRMTDVRLLSSSAAKPLDRAARGALLGSLLRPLPPDYAPESITMRVTFYYGSGPPSGT